MLEDLVQVIETIQGRIHEHGPSLRENETRTRMALINPLLTVLGWDVSDPSVVTPEYRVDVGWADYALAGPGDQPAAVIEAKRLGSTVDNHLDQAVGYCIQQGIAYAGVTDGEHWHLYRTFDPVPIADKLVLDLHIGNTTAYRCALQLLLLWRPNLASGQPRKAGEPITGPVSTPTTTNEATDSFQPPTSVDAGGFNKLGWTRFSQYSPPQGPEARSSPPSAIRIRDGMEQPVSRWIEILVLIAEWLCEHRMLTRETIPVQPEGRGGYLANSLPIQPDGSPMARHRYIGPERIAIYTNLSRIGVVQNSKLLLQHCGVDPSQVYVQTG